MKKDLVSKILRILLALDMLFSGLLFWFGTTLGVDDFKLIIDRLGYPEYVLGAIGIGKILIGLNLLLAKQFIWRTYGYFAIFINMFLAVYSHLAVSGHCKQFHTRTYSQFYFHPLYFGWIGGLLISLLTIDILYDLRTCSPLDK
jgi:hypothetical protein